MTGTLLLTRGDVAELLPIAECIDAVEDALRAQAAGRALPADVLGLHLPAGGLHVKAAGLRLGRLYVAAKINANLPDNPARGLPTIQGLVALYDGDDGRPLAVLDSMEITALRTGAATAVAARHLARPEARTVALCGCGAQAAYQVRALAAVRPIRAVFAYDRDVERAKRLASRVAAETAVSATALDDLRSAARQADVVVTCTPSKRPVVGLDDVRPGTFVAAVGADSPVKQEIDPRLLAASRVVVDSLDQAAVLGDLHHALEAGVLRREDVHGELWELVAGRKPGRTSSDEVTVFDSTGIALEDVAAAAFVFERAVATGRGRPLTFGS